MEVVFVIKSSDGDFHSACKNVCCANSIKELSDFFKGNCTTAGYSINYLTNGTEIIEVVKKGRLVQRDLKELFLQGFTNGFFSWAWAPKRFLINGQMLEVSKTINGVTIKDAISYKGLLY